MVAQQRVQRVGVSGQNFVSGPTTKEQRQHVIYFGMLALLFCSIGYTTTKLFSAN
jgi:hypothetical protein